MAERVFGHERFSTRKKDTMASAYYQHLKASLERLITLDGQLQFMTTRTGFSNECLRRVLVHLNAQPLFGDDGDLEARARNAGVSVEHYAVEIVRTIARLSGEAYAVVIPILSAVGELNSRRREIVQELTRLRASGDRYSSELHKNTSGTRCRIS